VPVRTRPKYHQHTAVQEFRQWLNLIRGDLDVLEKKQIARRWENRERLLRYVGRYGPNAPPPKLVEQTAADRKREIALKAQLDLAMLLVGVSVDKDPQTLRAFLKTQRDRLGCALIHESQLRSYLRERNRAIGWLQVQLDAYLGPDPAPIGEWGRSCDVAAGAYERALGERWNTWLFCVDRSPLVPEDEFAPDAMLKCFKKWLIEHHRVWFHLAILKLRKQRSTPGAVQLAFDKLLDKAIDLAEHRFFYRAQLSQTEEHLTAAVQKLTEYRGWFCEMALVEGAGEIWDAACAELAAALDSPFVRDLFKGRTEAVATYLGFRESLRRQGKPCDYDDIT
jgi:hypothetical protein